MLYDSKLSLSSQNQWTSAHSNSRRGAPHTAYCRNIRTGVPVTPTICGNSDLHPRTINESSFNPLFDSTFFPGADVEKLPCSWRRFDHVLYPATLLYQTSHYIQCLRGKPFEKYQMFGEMKTSSVVFFLLFVSSPYVNKVFQFFLDFVSFFWFFSTLLFKLARWGIIAGSLFLVQNYGWGMDLQVHCS